MHFEYTMHVVSLWEKWMGVYNIYVSYPHSTLKEVCIHCLTVLLSFKRQNQPYSKPTTYNFNYGYLNWESYYNLSYYTMILPPIPEDCPLPMGTKGESDTTTHRRPHPWGILNMFLSLQANLFFLIPKCWLKGFLRERNLGQTLRDPIWCLPSWLNTSPISFSKQTMKFKGASPRL